MENKAHAIVAGAFVVGLVAAVIALVLWFTRDTTVRNTYELSTRDPVSGLQPQAAVRYRGIAVGKVVAIDFDPKVKANVLVRISVDARVPLTATSFATLSYQGVTGLAFIALDDQTHPGTPLAPDNSSPPRLPLKPSALAELQDRGSEILDESHLLMRRLNNLMNDDNQQAIANALRNLARASEAADRLTRDLNRTLRQRVDPGLQQLPTLASETADTLQTMKSAATDVARAANNFNTTVTRLNRTDGPLDRLSEGTQSLGQAVDSFSTVTLPRMNRVAEDTSRTVRRLGRTAANINENPQSLLFGNGESQPGPGEPGFQPPTVAPSVLQ